jgi:hypothetical protein
MTFTCSDMLDMPSTNIMAAHVALDIARYAELYRYIVPYPVAMRLVARR